MKNLLQSVVVKRILWTMFFLFVYVLGSRLTLPFVNIDSQNFLGGASAMLAFSTAMMGGNLRSLSLFSVGLSPWMSAMILWQMFSLSKKLGLGNLPIEVQDRRKMILTFVIGLIQALAITLNLPVQDGVPAGLVIFMNTILLIAGSFFLVWLSDINSLLGLGGSVVILMAGMMGTMPENIWRSVQTLNVGPVLIVLLVLLGMIMLYLAVVVQRARYRIPVNKINIHNRFKKYSYLDIMLNPSGGMPFMYAMSLVAIPQYVLMLVQVLFPSNNWASAGIQAFSMGQPLWIWTYIIVLFILGIAFSFVNLSGEQLAEKMKKSGEYIYDIYPGQATSQYLNRLVLRFAIIGSVYTVLMAGTPMLVVLYDPDYLQLSMIPGLFLIFSGMIFNVKEEIKAITLNETYKPLF